MSSTTTIRVVTTHGLSCLLVTGSPASTPRWPLPSAKTPIPSLVRSQVDHVFISLPFTILYLLIVVMLWCSGSAALHSMIVLSTSCQEPWTLWVRQRRLLLLRGGWPWLDRRGPVGSCWSATSMRRSVTHLHTHTHASQMDHLRLISTTPIHHLHPSVVVFF